MTLKALLEQITPTRIRPDREVSGSQSDARQSATAVSPRTAEIGGKRAVGQQCYPWWTYLAVVAQCTILSFGVLAVLILTASNSNHSPLCIVQVEGESMHPTLHNHQQVLVARVPVAVGNIVLADVSEQEPVIKRVVCKNDDTLVLAGDNALVSRDYLARPDDVRGVVVLRMPFSSPYFHTDQPNRIQYLQAYR